MSHLNVHDALTCPINKTIFYLAGSEQQVEQPVDFQFAQTELMMNEIGSGTFLSEFDLHIVGSLLSILLMQFSSACNYFFLMSKA